MEVLLKPAFDGLRNSVQDALFKPLAGQITAVAQALGGRQRVPRALPGPVGVQLSR